MSLLDALENLSQRYAEVEALVADPSVMADAARYTAFLRERGSLEGRVQSYREYRATEKALADARAAEAVETDPEMREMFLAEITDLERRLAAQLAQLREIFVGEDEDSNRNVILEIRAGTGGDEAALFAGDLLRMYSYFAQRQGWKVEVMDLSHGTKGGLKEVVANVVGEGVYRKLRFESGTHRVQRVPETEAQGRVHTSAATVAVLPEAPEIEVKLRNEDLRIDTFCASGPGGQKVNKTESAIRITHVPTGLVVQCQDEKSQHKNKARAMKVLASRLYEYEAQKVHDERSADRKAQVGSGDRSERIRTYNFPQNRLTDHRIGLTVYNLDRVVDGELDTIVDALLEHDKEEKLKSLGV
jgi:peptide chain release factor 1